MDNVSVIKDIYAAFGRGDVAGILSHVAEDCVWSMEAPASIPWRGLRRGHAEILGFFTAIVNESTNQKLDMRHFVASGGDVAVFGRYECTMNATGKHVDSPVAHYWRLRDGKAVEYNVLLNTAAYA